MYRDNTHRPQPDAATGCAVGRPVARAAAEPASARAQPARRDRRTMVPAVAAWQLTEGSELRGQVTVLLVEREPSGRTVEVVTDEPARLMSAPRTWSTS